MSIIVGLDWGGASHAVCVLDGSGKVLERFLVTHDLVGLADLAARLRRWGPPSETPVAIERPGGLIVDCLVDAGFIVTPIHPAVPQVAVDKSAPGMVTSAPTSILMLSKAHPYRDF